MNEEMNIESYSFVMYHENDRHLVIEPMMMTTMMFVFEIYLDDLINHQTFFCFQGELTQGLSISSSIGYESFLG